MNTINRNELEKALGRFSKFNVETSGMQLCCLVSTTIKFEFDNEADRPKVFNIVQSAIKFRNIFPNQIKEVADYILSRNDERFITKVLNNLN